MKRDMDLIRNLLLEIEANENINGHFTITDRDFGVPDEDLRKVQYHLRLLFDADYLRGVDGSTVLEVAQNASERGTYLGADARSTIMLATDPDERKAIEAMATQPMIMVERITWQGHEFIETVRDDKIWEKTKETMNTVGNFGIENVKAVASALAKGFMKKQVEKLTGVELEF